MEDGAYMAINSSKQTDSPPRGEYSHPKPQSPKKWALHGLKPVGLSTGLHATHHQGRERGQAGDPGTWDSVHSGWGPRERDSYWAQDFLWGEGTTMTEIRWR